VSTTDPREDAAAAADAIPARTTPTWEMEMLLSGATVFGLLQLPEALNAAVEPVLARLGGGVGLVASILTVYVGAAVYLLLATFVGHLVIRGFWIALLGLRSVFPEGPDFDKLRGGPISRHVARRNAVRTEDEIERLDNLATIVFMFGAMAVVGALVPGLFVLPMLVATWLWPDVPVGPLMLAVFGVVFGPMALVATIDSLFGRHLDVNGRIARAFAAILTFYQRLTQPRFTNALTTTLMTRLGFGRFMVVYMGVLFAVLLVYGIDSGMRRGGIAIGDYTAIPADAERGYAVLPQHYRDQRRDDDRLQRVPFLDSTVLKGDWLRLIVPFHPTRHEAAIERQCPEVWANLPLSDALDAAAADAAHRDLLACYRDLAAIHVDGRPVDVLPDIVVLPDTRLRGLQFMIDARDLAPGRHQLQTAKLAHPEKDDAGAKPASYRIPFWK
jgi:hypothetical protein